MKITNLFLENYGPFETLDVSLSQITVLVGNNGVGKSCKVQLILSSNNLELIKAKLLLKRLEVRHAQNQ